MNKLLIVLSWLALFSSPAAHALDLLNLNVFDQLQGKWEPDFREKRMAALARYLEAGAPDVVVFEEARGALPGAERGGADSADAAGIKGLYPHRVYAHEMAGADGASYGYWVGAKRKPRMWVRDGFSFPGGVDRKVLGGIWDDALGGACLGVLGLHLSYQSSEVRQKEARWLLGWVKKHEADCPHWLVVGDFNADQHDKEMQILFRGGLKPLTGQDKPTVGAFNPIRRIYGENIRSQTIDWALGWKLEGQARAVLDSPFEGLWLSDHAAVRVSPQLPPQRGRRR